MNSVKDFRKSNDFDSGDIVKKGTKLAPIRKSGKERHHLYSSLSDDEEAELDNYKGKKESTLDYFDDDEH